MELNEIIGMLPEDKREAVKTELTGYVKVASREDAERLAKDHPHVKSALDSFISKAVASHDERFKAEVMPKLVDDEIIKRNPPKDPRDLKVYELEQKLKDMESQTVREKQTALATKLAAEAGIPTDLASIFIGTKDEETIEKITSLSGVLKSWKDSAVNSEVAVRLNNNKAPVRGSTPDEKKQMEAEYANLMRSGKTLQAFQLKERINSMKD